MCGRYSLFTDSDNKQIKAIIQEAELHAKQKIESAFQAEVYPTNPVPVLLPEPGCWASYFMHWGFPSTANGKVVINARAETAESKAMFRNSLLYRRCLVPSTGFYEWKKSGAQKEKYLFTFSGENTLFMAGIYSKFKQPNGEEKNHFVILTTKANSSMEEIHDRMPVVLRPEEYDVWADGDFRSLLRRESVLLSKEYRA